MKDSFHCGPESIPKWPEGFDDVTCPRALHLIAWLTSEYDRGPWIKEDHPHLIVTAELFRNHVSFNQAYLLLEHADFRHSTNLQILDLISIYGGGLSALNQKYKLEKSFQVENNYANRALEDYLEHEFYLELPDPNCELKTNFDLF